MIRVIIGRYSHVHVLELVWGWVFLLFYFIIFKAILSFKNCPPVLFPAETVFCVRAKSANFIMNYVDVRLIDTRLWGWAGTWVGAHYLSFWSLGFIFPRDSVSPPTSSTVLKGVWEVVSKSVIGQEGLCKKGDWDPWHSSLRFKAMEKPLMGEGMWWEAPPPERGSSLGIGAQYCVWGGWPGCHFWAQPLLVQPLASHPLAQRPLVAHTTRRLELLPIPHLQRLTGQVWATRVIGTADKTRPSLGWWVGVPATLHGVQETLLQSLFLQKGHVVTAAAEAMVRFPHFLF